MKYRMIILDLDDTTVVHGKEHLPTDAVRQALLAAQKKVHICIATARTLRDTMPVVESISHTGYCVVTNGTMIYDAAKKTVIEETLLPADVIPAILAVCKTYNFRPVLYNGRDDVPFDGITIPDNLHSVYVPEVDINKIDFFVKEFAVDPRVHVQKLNAWNKKYMSIDITSTDASKLHGVVTVSKLLGIKAEETIGVGDGYNDFPLLMASGLKIAMGNAVPELKAIADFVAPTVYEDGVATVVEKFILNGRP